MKPHGIDFGTYTQWAEPDNPPKPIDFVIAGTTWGDWINQTYEANKLHLRQVKRLMTYHGYDNDPPAAMASKALETAREVGSRAMWIDWEGSSYHTLSAADVPKLKDFYYRLKDQFPRVGIYSNHNDYMIIQNADPQFAESFEWWLAWPGVNPETVTNYAYVFRTRIKRPFSTVRFFQYAWNGDGAAYGAINDKKSMDLNVFMGTMEELDAWLGEEPPSEKKLSDRVKELASQVEAISLELKEMGL